MDASYNQSHKLKHKSTLKEDISNLLKWLANTKKKSAVSEKNYLFKYLVIFTPKNKLDDSMSKYITMKEIDKLNMD